MRRSSANTHLFVVGRDYHLGDLLWLTAVLREYRRQMQPRRLVVVCPDRPITRILEGIPSIDEVIPADGDAVTDRIRNADPDLIVRDLRPLAVAVTMLRDFSRRLPWLYYRDLWLEPRGQWLATYLRLGTLHDYRPEVALRPDDYIAAQSLPSRYVALAAHVGSYSLPFAGRIWRRIKGWPAEHWTELAAALRSQGFEPVTLAARDQPAIPGTTALLGLPIRQVAGIIDRAGALVTGESGLWFIAAATRTPFVIVPWWLPPAVDWPAPMRVPYRLIYRNQASVDRVLSSVNQLVQHAA